MRKNRTTTYTFLFIFAFIILIVPAVLSAQDETGSEEETAEELGPGPLWDLLTNSEVSLKQSLAIIAQVLFYKFLPILLKLLPVIVIASLIKIRLMKQKFTIPWKLKPIEKLSITTFAETAVEMYFLLVFIIFFIPAVSSVIKGTALAQTTTEIGRFFKFIVHTLAAIPYQCVLGAILSLLLLHILTPMSLRELRQYFKFGASLALIPPATLIVFIVFTRILFKWNYI
jgi:hypothetical protein